ncbi:MAG: hypothetical protein J0L62_11975 [Bacteroidetes bacterium]|nr:hypothetical protein [Bacteroidota bacterium]
MKTLLSLLIPVLVLFSSCEDNSTDSSEETVTWVGDWIMTENKDYTPYPLYYGFRISEENKIAEIGLRHETGRFDFLAPYNRFETFTPNNETSAIIKLNFGLNNRFEASATLKKANKSITITYPDGDTFVFFYSDPGKKIHNTVTSTGSFSFNSSVYSSPSVSPSVPFWALEYQDTLTINLNTMGISGKGAYLSLRIPAFTGSASYSVLKSMGTLRIIGGGMSDIFVVHNYSVETPNINAITITQNGDQLTGTFQLTMQDWAGYVYEVTNGSFSVPLIKR